MYISPILCVARRGRECALPVLMHLKYLAIAAEAENAHPATLRHPPKAWRLQYVAPLLYAAQLRSIVTGG